MFVSSVWCKPATLFVLTDTPTVAQSVNFLALHASNARTQPRIHTKREKWMKATVHRITAYFPNEINFYHHHQLMTLHHFQSPPSKQFAFECVSCHRMNDVVYIHIFQNLWKYWFSIFLTLRKEEKKKSWKRIFKDVVCKEAKHI